MASRAELKEQKKKTSTALIQAAIQLCAEEGYVSLSIRSLSRKAGIAPTSFYRHFRDINELGVAIVEIAETVLDKCMSQARKKMVVYSVPENSTMEKFLQSIECAVRPFVEIFIEFFYQNRDLFYLFFQEQTGSSEVIRTAVSKKISHMSEFLSEDLTRISTKFPDGFNDIPLIAESMITIVSHTCVVMLLNQEPERTSITEQLIKKINLFLLGAALCGKITQRNDHE